jgi:purine-binding chemotaxis protein CheW
LVCRVGARACALPLEHVREVMRPSPVAAVPSAQKYVLGLGVIRGETVPVLDAALLLAGQSAPATRFVVLRVGERRVALAVGEVVGARILDRAELAELPPLLSEARDRVSALAVLDGDLLQVLESTRLLDAAELGLSGAQAPA